MASVPPGSSAASAGSTNSPAGANSRHGSGRARSPPAAGRNTPAGSGCTDSAGTVTYSAGSPRPAGSTARHRRCPVPPAGRRPPRRQPRARAPHSGGVPADPLRPHGDPSGTLHTRVHATTAHPTPARRRARSTGPAGACLSVQAPRTRQARIIGDAKVSSATRCPGAGGVRRRRRRRERRRRRRG